MLSGLFLLLIYLHKFIMHTELFMRVLVYCCSSKISGQKSHIDLLNKKESEIKFSDDCAVKD